MSIRSKSLTISQVSTFQNKFMTIRSSLDLNWTQFYDLAIYNVPRALLSQFISIGFNHFNVCSLISAKHVTLMYVWSKSLTISQFSFFQDDFTTIRSSLGINWTQFYYLLLKKCSQRTNFTLFLQASNNLMCVLSNPQNLSLPCLYGQNP